MVMVSPLKSTGLWARTGPARAVARKTTAIDLLIVRMSYDIGLPFGCVEIDAIGVSAALVELGQWSLVRPFVNRVAFLKEQDPWPRSVLLANWRVPPSQLRPCWRWGRCRRKRG